MHGAFGVGTQAISQAAAKPQPLLRSVPPLPSPPAPRADMHLSTAVERFSASTGPGTQSACMEMCASTSTHAASVVPPRMERESVASLHDPRIVVTPLDPVKVERLLGVLGLDEDWADVVRGLREGFDVGVRGTLSRSYLFRESFIFFTRHFIHFELHYRRAGCWPVLNGVQPRVTGAVNRFFSHITTGPSSQTEFIQITNGSRHVISSQQRLGPISECGNRLGRVPNGLGNIRSDECLSFIPSPGLRGSYIRHLSRLPNHSNQARPAVCTLRLLGWPGLCRPGSNVWFSIERWGVWVSSGYAGRNLHSQRDGTNSEMGRRLLCHQAPTPQLDRGGFHGSDRSHRCPMERTKIAEICSSPTLHWFRLGSGEEESLLTTGESREDTSVDGRLVDRGSLLFSIRGSEPPWEAGTCIEHLQANPPIPPINFSFCSCIFFAAYSPCTIAISTERPGLGEIYHSNFPIEYPTCTANSIRYPMVGRCKHNVWNRCSSWTPLCLLEVCAGVLCRSQTRVRHRLGRSSGCRTRVKDYGARGTGVQRSLSFQFAQCFTLLTYMLAFCLVLSIVNAHTPLQALHI
ncbi:hypothetical protein C8R42DRAFT_148112 [Lentinula raphanica]|nr:hypothetical protein C8R42DRAFT_148112 [Lentinula raphanica]